MNEDELKVQANKVLQWFKDHHRATLGIVCFIAGFVTHWIIRG